MSGPAGNLGRINDDLQDVTRIMTKNMEDLLWRGDSLDSQSRPSSSIHRSRKIVTDRSHP